MVRCGCQDSCSCLITAGPGVTVEGIGTLERPYEISADTGELEGRVVFTDDGSVDFTTTGAGSVLNPLVVFGDVALTGLSDVPVTPPVDGQGPVWVSDHWEWGSSGSGVPPGGTDGQVLTKQSATDGDALWEDPTGGSISVNEKVYATSRQHSAAILAVANATNVAIPWDTAQADDGSIPFSVATGMFTIPVTGWYQINAKVTFPFNATGQRSVRVLRNGASADLGVIQIAPVPVANATTVQFSRALKFTAGDQVHVSASQSSGGALDVAYGGISYNSVDIFKVPAPATGTVVASEPTYAASRRQSAAVSCTTGTVTLVPWDTEDFTDGIAFAAGVFTVPVAGYYQVTAKVGWDANGSGYRRLRIAVNGASGVPGYGMVPPSASANTVTMLTRTVKLAAGDQIQVSIDQTSGVTLGTAASTAFNSIDIVKVPSPAPLQVGERIYSTSRRQAAVVPAANNTQVQIPWDTLDHADGITCDAAGIFTFPVAGYYQVNVKVAFASNATGKREIRILLNGASAVPGIVLIPPITSASGTNVQFSRLLKVAAGDTLQIGATQTSGVTLDAASAGVAYNSIDITKVPEPGAGTAISGERNYAAIRRSVVAQSFATGVVQTVDYEISDTADGITWDTPNKQFVIPVAGYYTVEATVHFATGGATGQRTISVLINGAIISTIQTGASTAGGTNPFVSRTFLAAAGDTVRIQASQGSGGTVLLTTSAAYNFATIRKVPAPTVPGSAASGVWGVAPLAAYGADSLIGRPVYVDSKGQLRAEPIGIPKDCAGEITLCTDVSAAANPGSSILRARYTKIGKTVTFWGQGVMGSGAVVNGAILLPPSAGTPAYAIAGPPLGQMVTAGSPLALGATFISADLTRLLSIPNNSAAYHDFLANTNVYWNFTYEVL